jgi:drug/metabolite transporter (DMT)-like permease
MATPARDATTIEPPAARKRAGMGAAGAYLLLVVAMLSWSGNMIVGRALAGTVPPLGLSLMRWSIAFAVVLPFVGVELVAKRAILLRHWRILLLLGLLGVTICNSLSYVGLQWTTALNGALVNSAGPMLTLLAAFVFNRERATPWQLAGILLSLAGVLVIVLRGDPAALVHLSINRGDMALLLGVATWSIYTVLLHRRPPELSPVALLAVLFGVGAVTLLPLHLAESWGGRALPATPEAILGYLYVGIFPAVIAFFGWNRGVAVIGANRASLFSHLIPLFSVGLAYVFLGERIAGFHIAGGALIFLGIFLANRR